MSDTARYLRTCLNSGNFRLAERHLQTRGVALPPDLYHPCGKEDFLTEDGGWLSPARVLSLHPWLVEQGYPVDESAYRSNHLQALLRHPSEDVAAQALASPDWPGLDHPDAQLMLRASLHGPSGRLAWTMTQTGWTGTQVTRALAEWDAWVEVINLTRQRQGDEVELKTLARDLAGLQALGVTSLPAIKTQGVVLAAVLSTPAWASEQGAFLDLWQSLIQQGHNTQAMNENGITRQQEAEARYPDLFRSQDRHRALAQRPAVSRRSRLRS